MAETHEVLKRGAERMAGAARVIEAFRQTTGDPDGGLAWLLVGLRTSADEVAAEARAARPSKAVADWTRGNAAAMANWHPTPHADRADMKKG